MKHDHLHASFTQCLLGFLQSLQPGDLIQLETRESSRWFEVRYIEVIDSRTEELIIDPGADRISLVTCYPFDSLQTGARSPTGVIGQQGPFKSRDIVSIASRQNHNRKQAKEAGQYREHPFSNIHFSLPKRLMNHGHEV